VMQALQYLNSFDMTYRTEDHSHIGHGSPGQYVRTLGQVGPGRQAAVRDRSLLIHRARRRARCGVACRDRQGNERPCSRWDFAPKGSQASPCAGPPAPVDG
jgi:hypothetical protein